MTSGSVVVCEPRVSVVEDRGVAADLATFMEHPDGPFARPQSRIDILVTNQMLEEQFPVAPDPALARPVRVIERSNAKVRRLLGPCNYPLLFSASS